MTMQKRMYEAPTAEQMELEYPVLMAGTPEGEAEQGGTSDKPYEGEGL